MKPKTSTASCRICMYYSYSMTVEAFSRQALLLDKQTILTRPRHDIVEVIPLDPVGI